MRTRLWIPVLLALGTSVSLGLTQQNPALLDVKKVYISDLGREEGADLVREKIRVKLMKSGRFTVLEKPDGADAILAGVAGVEASHSDKGTSYKGLGVLRLIDPKTESTIWLFEYKRGFSLRSASSRVAGKTVSKLLKDIRAAEQTAEKARKASDEKKPPKRK